MLFCGINDNILIPRLPYSGLYQDAAKIRALQREQNALGLESNHKQNWKTVVQFSPSMLSHCIFECVMSVLD